MPFRKIYGILSLFERLIYLIVRFRAVAPTVPTQFPFIFKRTNISLPSNT